MQVLAQLNYCKSKQEEYKQLDSNAPPHIDKSCKQAEGARGGGFFLILSVGKNRFLIRLEVLGKLIQTLLVQ